MSGPRIVRPSVPTLVGALVVLAAPGSGVAHAAQVVGPDPLVAPTGDGGAGLCPDPGATACTVALLADGAGRPAAVPADGVLVAVRLRGAAGATGAVGVRILRPSGDGFTPVASVTGPELDASGDEQETSVRASVRAGDVLAIRGGTLPPLFAASTGEGVHAVFGEPPSWPVGAPDRLPDDAATVPGDLQLAGVVERDADADGYGDETQDACTVDAARQGPCAIDLVAAATAPTFAVTGGVASHLYEIRNRGASPAPDVILELDAVRDATLLGVTAPAGCATAEGVAARCALGTLDRGAIARVSVAVTAPAGALARTRARVAGAGVELVAGDEAAAAQTLFTPPSIAPQPMPFPVVPCANVRTGTGDDEVLEGTGFGDRLIGRAGRDLLRGEAGPDCLEGGEGADVLDGDGGDDRLAGAAGNDRLDGGFGADTLRGGLGHDVLVGGPGNDVLLPGPGRDRVVAGGGDDIVEARDGVRETIDCGRGSDRARVDRGDRVRGCERVARG